MPISTVLVPFWSQLYWYASFVSAWTHLTSSYKLVAFDESDSFVYAGRDLAPRVSVFDESHRIRQVGNHPVRNPPWTCSNSIKIASNADRALSPQVLFEQGMALFVSGKSWKQFMRTQMMNFTSIADSFSLSLSLSFYTFLCLRATVKMWVRQRPGVLFERASKEISLCSG